MKNVILLSVILLLSSCASGFKTKRLVYSTQKLAIYELDRDELTNNKLIDSKIKHPYKISAKKLIDIIGNVRFIKTTRINKYNDYVFHLDELNNSADDISQTLENFDEKKVVVVVSIYDHLQSVVSNFKRTSFLMWIDNEGLNLVFGDIQDDVSKDKGLNFYDWTQIDPISLEFKPDENQIITDNDIFTYKKVKGYYHRKWLIFPLKDLDKYKLKERVDSNKKPD
ncbi:MAG: hypothetical protein EBS19_06910 [Spirochaetia bacterium]|nr:hypothetical protein [Spirochaetia bacterium]